MKLVTSPAVPSSADHWTDLTGPGGAALFSGNYDRSLDAVLPLKGHLVAYGREGGIPRVWVAKLGGDDVERFDRLEFDEEAYDVGSGGNLEFDVESFKVSYDSLVTPPSTVKIDLDDLSSRSVVKEKKIPGYDASKYACSRSTVLSRDGKTEIPVSMVWNKALRKVRVSNL